MIARSALWLLAVLAAVGVNGDETVMVRAVEVDGGRPIGATAELLVDSWYAQKSIALPTRDGLVVVPLTREWLCDQWPEGCAATDHIEARILLSAPGRAAVASDPFQWPRSSAESPASSPEIAFSFAPAAAAVGEEAVLVPMRPAGSRTLHARDRAGRPLGGVSFNVAIYFSTGGHCAVIRSRPLATVATDASGDVSVPDGDFDYHLELRTPHLAFAAAPDPQARRTLVTPLRDGVAELVVFRPAVLRIEVVGVADPAKLALAGCIRECPGGVCGACCGMLAEVSAAGLVEIEDFYPDEYSEIYLAGDDGEIWRAAVGDLDLSGTPIIVRRPSARSRP